MAAARDSGSGTRDPAGAEKQMWEAGYESLFEGWRQTQDFWTKMARSWGDASGAWMRQFNRSAGASGGGALLKALQEAAFEVAQAWLRLPMIVAEGASPEELQGAITRLTEAQGRAYQMWLEALGRLGGKASDAAAEATPAGAEKRP